MPDARCPMPDARCPSQMPEPDVRPVGCLVSETPRRGRDLNPRRGFTTPYSLSRRAPSTMLGHLSRVSRQLTADSRQPRTLLSSRKADGRARKAGEHLPSAICHLSTRRRWDSNPRNPDGAQQFSRLPPSSTRPPLQGRVPGSGHRVPGSTSDTRYPLPGTRNARRGWDLNPRDRKAGPTVFETAAFGRSATPPMRCQVSGVRYQPEPTPWV